MTDPVTRRVFVGAAAAASASGAVHGRPALLGGMPVRGKAFPSWPEVSAADEKAIVEALRSRKWNRSTGSRVASFEETWARTLGAKHCVAVANGTSALLASLAALDVGPGDEVIVPPYTFVATINVVLTHHALPVFVDTDPETFQIDARKIEAAITPRTRCLLPVHLGGSAADMDTILEVARKHRLPVIEDAAQAHFGEWKKRKLSTLGDLGCFSFQASKNLNSGEGGAILSNDDRLIEACVSFQNQGRGTAGYARNGLNLRLTEFQGAILTSQFERLEAQSVSRETNAAYLTSMLREIPGIHPARMYDGCTRNGYHLYMFRYDAKQFSGLPRARFLEAMKAEGIPSSGGYRPLNKEKFIHDTLNSRGYQRIYSPEDRRAWHERNHCPANDRLCEEAVWFTQNMLLGKREDMEQIAEAVRKIEKHAGALA